MQRIYECDPIDKQAALVTSQKNVSETDDLNRQELRANLITKLNRLEMRIGLLSPRDPERKRLGVEKFSVQNELSRYKNPHRNESLQSHIVNVAKEIVSEFVWKRIMDDAWKRHNAEHGLEDMK